MNLTLADIQPETSDVTSFLFEPEGELEWQPGQYLRYRIPHQGEDERGPQRYFTAASAPHERHVRLTTRRAAERGSTFKEALFGLEPGAIVEADAPAGSFTLEEPEGEYVLIAGGIGITPFRAILVDLAHRGKRLDGKLIYANRNDEIVFRDELDDLSFALGLSIRYLVDPERIDARLLAEEVPNPAGARFYISGPKPMVDAIQDLALAHGAAEELLKRDAFPGYG